MRRALLLLLLAGCRPLSRACTVMCDEATALQGQCLAQEGRTWQDIGFQDAADHTAWCHTWVWEQRLLDRDAGQRGHTERVCEMRALEFQSASCAAYEDVAW